MWNWSYEVHVATEFQYIFSSLNTRLTLTNQIPHKLVPSSEETCSTASEASLTMTSSDLTEWQCYSAIVTHQPLMTLSTITNYPKTYHHILPSQTCIYQLCNFTTICGFYFQHSSLSFNLPEQKLQIKLYINMVFWKVLCLY